MPSSNEDSVVRAARTLETRTTPFNTMSVVQVGKRIDLDVEGATYATFHPDRLLTGYSWDALSMACLLRPAGPPSSILMLGLGGGTVARQLRRFLPECRLVGVEIDPGVVELARRHMQLDDADVEAHVVDAYDFLATSADTFDVVIDDLFLTGTTDVVRSRVPSGATLDLVRQRVAPGGLVVANLITDTGDHAVVRAQTRAAFKGAFARTRVVTPPRGLNEILVGGDAVATGRSLSLYAPLVGADDRKLFDAVDVSAL
ncbi:MAG TPA: fused MFS/spermidine synthase [Myxococcota bacterium]